LTQPPVREVCGHGKRTQDIWVMVNILPDNNDGE
jgi:hypothetical protein